ncbi:MAG: hypothetical protein ABUS57_13815 [Pseudomonadota bacterium]
MKKSLAFAAIAAVIATTAIAAPASAAPFRGGHDNINQRQMELSRQVEFGQRSGRLTVGEARGLRSDLRQIDYMESRFRRNGLNWQERSELDRRLDQVQNDLQRELRDRDHRGDGHRDRRGY